ncbi:oxygenase [Lithospermum erythrorhizon]|uniref:Oxygenase n=1 Tax=Lithospermum erythrorhizon TaxID=34254 RepID=A0AAV3NPD4_LITER
MDKKAMKKAKAIVVGGSISGLSCAHALVSSGWEVVVVEKTPSPPTGSPTGAGLGLDPLVQSKLSQWLMQPHLLQNTTMPLSIDQNQATDVQMKINRTLTRDERYNFRAAYWADLHNLLYSALPSNIVLWGHKFLSFSISDCGTSVEVKTKIVETDDVISITGDVLIAADGCLSSIREVFLPGLKLRYSGYCAWRGVLDCSGDEHTEAIEDLKRAYPDLGRCLYLNLSSGTHSVLYELLNKRLNWLWFVNQPEPVHEGHSTTMKVSSDMVLKMHEEAEKVWLPEFTRIMKETAEPFINAIYDMDPLERIYWKNVVLVGDAAHPTTPHGARSTNMAIVDAAVLGQCLRKWGVERLDSALHEYQSIRLPVVSQQVLHSRRMGLIKQGLVLPDGSSFNPSTALPKDCEDLQMQSMPFFSETPPILM